MRLMLRPSLSRFALPISEGEVEENLTAGRWERGCERHALVEALLVAAYGRSEREPVRTGLVLARDRRGFAEFNGVSHRGHGSRTVMFVLQVGDETQPKACHETESYKVYSQSA